MDYGRIFRFGGHDLLKKASHLLELMDEGLTALG